MSNAKLSSLKLIALSLLLASEAIGLPALPAQAKRQEIKTQEIKTVEATDNSPGVTTADTGSKDSHANNQIKQKTEKQKAEVNNLPNESRTTSLTAGTEADQEDNDDDSAAVSLEVKTDVEDLDPTDNVELARKQVTRYPDSPEASFILAVALTRTSRVEEALKEVRRARKLAEAQGGVTYFDKMIESYEKMLKNYPEENRVRYGLAWAYYMKAYLLANYSQKVATWKALSAKQAARAETTQPASPTINPPPATAPGTQPPVTESNTATLNKETTEKKVADNLTGQALEAVSSAIGLNNNGNSMDKLVKAKLPTPIDKAEPQDIPQIKQYYQLALKHLDDLLLKKPDDIWAAIYRAHLLAEYTGDMSNSMKIWTEWRDKYPNNPAPYFFLGEGYLKQGNLKESLNNVSRAIALRAMGF